MNAKGNTEKSVVPKEHAVSMTEKWACFLNSEEVKWYKRGDARIRVRV